MFLLIANNQSWDRQNEPSVEFCRRVKIENFSLIFSSVIIRANVYGQQRKERAVAEKTATCVQGEVHHLVRVEAEKDLGAWHGLVKLDKDGVKSRRRKALLAPSSPISVQRPRLFPSFWISSKCNRMRGQGLNNMPIFMLI